MIKEQFFIEKLIDRIDEAILKLDIFINKKN